MNTRISLRRRQLLAAGLAITVGAAAALPTDARAAYPDKALHIVVPFAPGGGTDLIARTVAEAMAKDKDVGQAVIVDNKPGAGTIIGTDFVAKAAPDGYTLLLATFAHAVNPSLNARLPFSPEKSFAPVALIGRSPNVLVVRTDRPFKTVRDIVAYAQANPGKLSYGSYGNGTSAHLAGELFKSLAKIDLVHVPYKGSSPAITDLLGGQIDLMLTTVASAAQYIAAGRLRAVAVTSSTRSAAWPDIPTMAEAGVPGYVAESWYGLYAPAGTPREAIALLNAAVRRAVKTEAFRRRIEEEGLITEVGAPEELERYVRGEEARWRKLVQDAHIRAD
jgi:tripartite-type tricarboxylate transporter receptor subunit TctC